MLAYVSPQTVDNQELRQCLAYFIPAFCFSSPENQRKMSEVNLSHIVLAMQAHIDQISLSMFIGFSRMLDELDEDMPMISRAQVADLIVEWTNPEHLLYEHVPSINLCSYYGSSEIPGMRRDELVHIDLATDIVKSMFDDDIERMFSNALVIHY